MLVRNLVTRGICKRTNKYANNKKMLIFNYLFQIRQFDVLSKKNYSSIHLYKLLKDIYIQFALHVKFFVGKKIVEFRHSKSRH